MTRHARAMAPGTEDGGREALDLRHQLEAAIEAAIAVLDRLDAPVEDREPDADWEPWLAAPEDHPCQLHWCRGCDDDREHEDRPVPQVRRP